MRQLEIFDPEAFGNKPVHIIGVGATGSWVALILAKMGIKNVNIYDFDDIESHNLPNQAFRHDDIGTPKVEAVAKIAAEVGVPVASSSNKEVSGSDNFQGVLFILTDTMASRKEIFEKCAKFKFPVELCIETRLGTGHGMIYAIDPRSPSHVKTYEQTLYGDDEAEVSACGTTQSMAPTAIMLASYAVWQMIKWFNKEDIDNEVLME